MTLNFNTLSEDVLLITIQASTQISVPETYSYGSNPYRKLLTVSDNGSK